MARIRFSGPLDLRLSGLSALNAAAIATYARRLAGRSMEPSWGVDLEIGIRFWRRQFTRAMNASDMARGRLILDSVQTETRDMYEVDQRAEGKPRGVWHRPRNRTSRATILYFHGGGYAFHGAMSLRFAAMLAHHVGAPVFAPDYRLAPEHPHPAQAEDALAAWDHVTSNAPEGQVIVVGDSAGGHMMLMLLKHLRETGRAQPVLGIGLCPWTDIGDRGASLRDNDRYDLVQGWMALRFGEWLDPESRFGRDALSPIAYDFSGCAPLYLQAGGREILHDMIRDFAEKQATNGADVMLETWPAMPHDFQLFDSTQPDSTEALMRIVSAARYHTGAGPALSDGPNTVVRSRT